MSELRINLIDEETDLSIIQKYNWDIDVKGFKYHVCRVPEYYHSIGGKYGNNNLWCYPREEEPSFNNLLQFNGSPVRWGVVIDDSNYIKHKWGEGEILHTHWVSITRNGEEFYSFACGGLGYGMAKAQVLIARLEDHPISFNDIDFEAQIIGRKIWWHESPGIIRRYIKGQACVMIEPDGIEKFPRPSSYRDDDPYGEDIDIKAEIFDNNIWWFRD